MAGSGLFAMNVWRHVLLQKGRIRLLTNTCPQFWQAQVFIEVSPLDELEDLT